MIHRLRAAVRPIVPRRFRRAATKALGRLAVLALRGKTVECPCCGATYRRFMRYPSLYCPNCGSYERHRAFCLYLRERDDVFSRPLRMLHVAPEEALENRFRRAPEIDYMSIDLDYPLALRRMDVTELDFPDDSFDIVLCLHMLNEVPDEARALQELFRVTQPGGEVFVQLPLEFQRDDLAQSLASAGFEVREEHLTDRIPRELVERYGLIQAERLYVCRKPAGS